MSRLVHKFTNLEGLFTSIDVDSVVYFKEIQSDRLCRGGRLVRIVFDNKDVVYVKDSYEKVMEVFDFIRR